jgi:hypothetical protein
LYQGATTTAVTDDGDAAARETHAGDERTDDAGGDGADVAAVKAALERLARNGERPNPRTEPAAVVAAAAEATARLDETAAFLRADGRERLTVAVERLRAADRTVTADRGAAVLDALAAATRAAAERAAAERAPDDGADHPRGDHR